MTRARFFLLLLAALLPVWGCEEPARDLARLDVVDSVYVEPTTGEPWSGAVVRYFEDDSTLVQLEGALLEGIWHGELVVYHPNGRVRYMGSFERGERCGPWTENADSTALESVYEALLREVETMGIYPPCGGGSNE